MKIQCNVCEAAEATVLCCADEAALCWSCDEKVHAANKLASKHQRVALSASSSPMPKCDICQETVGYFFCLEDRALLCRKCDVAIHNANTFVSAHQRFLLTGVKVGLEAIEPRASSCSGKSHSGAKICEMESHPLPTKSVPGKSFPTSVSGQYNKVPAQVVGGREFVPPKLSFTGGTSAESIQQSQLDEFLELPELDQCYGYMENGSSKADSSKIGDSDCSPILRSLEVEMDSDDCLGQVPDASWAVPDIPSPPTASGLFWPKSQDHHLGRPAFVPDAATGTLDGIIDTVSADHAIVPLLGLLKSRGKLVIVGVPSKPFELPAFPLLFGGKMVAGSGIGGLKETQEMINFAAEHNITANVEVIPMDYVNTAMERLEKADVRYRFVIDVGNTLKNTA